MTRVWSLIAGHVVARLVPTGVLTLDVDDTLFHKSGRKVAGAGSFRDPIRSGGASVIYALGLNLIVVTVRIIPPWGGEPLGLPINLRLYTKGGRTHLELAAEMAEVANWFGERNFVLCGGGAYASLAACSLPRTQVVSRMRRDAALYEAPPPREKGQRGRPRKRGERLPAPEKIAETTTGWATAEVDLRGRPVELLSFSRPVLWYGMCPDAQVLLVVVRDPSRRQPDDLLFTTDLTASPAWVASTYAGRWSIEDTFKNVKQHLGGQEPQSWKNKAPERAAALSFLTYTAVWTWYLLTQGTKPSWPSLPWYPSKATPSFADALAGLRRVLWRNRIFATSKRRPLSGKMADVLIDALARAA